MNNKGFTLIELIVVIAILGIVGTVVTISITESIKAQNQKECDAYVKEIEDAACVYAGLSSVSCSYPCTINVSTLVSEGLVNSEVDACTGEEPSSTVEVSKDTTTGEKTCTYNGIRKYER